MELMPLGRIPESGTLARAVSAEVRAALARQRMSVRKLARAAGLTESYLGKRLRDDAPMTINDLESVCAALGEDVEDFFTAAIEAAKTPDSSH
jgi:transcriptional regulator with XRE-family HTH domain